ERFLRFVAPEYFRARSEKQSRFRNSGAHRLEHIERPYRIYVEGDFRMIERICDKTLSGEMIDMIGMDIPERLNKLIRLADINIGQPYLIGDTQVVEPPGFSRNAAPETTVNDPSTLQQKMSHVGAVLAGYAQNQRGLIRCH